ncbi:MAG: PIG-L family deacetylase [Methanobrevibacter sp.]|jgi:LmbE family N-acetylglucosaminyl deacetylase|nr:PIG-L family deacetylase [Methanobrevibacter sp.]
MLNIKKVILIAITIVAIIIVLAYTGGYFIDQDSEKIAFILPHADDETIGAGGVISMLAEKNCTLHFELMTSGNAISGVLRRMNNYYNVSIPKNASESTRKGLIREDSFKQVMKIFNNSNYILHGIDDGGLTTDDAFKTMEDLYLKDGYKTFYTTTGDGNIDHNAAHEALKKMQEKYPDLKYRQFPVYHYHNTQAIPEPANPNYIDLDVDKYANKKKEMFQVYYNINTILPSFYPRSDGEIAFGPERIYHNHDSIKEFL